MELGIIITHIDGQKRTRIGFKMIYYLLFYSAIFICFILFDGLLKRQWSSIKISSASFLISVLILLFWNLFLSTFFMEEALNDGVSIVLSSMLSVVVLFSYSAVLCVVLHIYRRAVK